VINRLRKEKPSVLTIAGSDSGGGAGIQADLKTFAAIGVHGTSAITAITAQNPVEVRSVQAVRPQMVRDQIAAVFAELRPLAVKTGMLYSKGIIRVVAEELSEKDSLIVDPVMISTSGSMLLESSAVGELKKLLRRSKLVTPNVQEAEHLLKRSLKSPEDLRLGAREFHETYGCCALMKGGHLKGMKVAVDFLYDGKSDWMFEAPYVRGVSTHGTGCTYSAAIAAYCALGHSIPKAVGLAKQFISNAIAMSYKTAGHFVLNTNWITNWIRE
jgi:hydroxymethylpyrimidine/phosphomethylpyrimidine kinase